MADFPQDAPHTFETDKWYDATIKTVKYGVAPSGRARLLFVLTNPTHGTIFHDEYVTPDTVERIRTLLCERFGLSPAVLADPAFWADPAGLLRGKAARIKTGMYKDRVEVKTLTTSTLEPKKGAPEEAIASAAALFGGEAAEAAEAAAASSAFFSS